MKMSYLAILLSFLAFGCKKDKAAPAPTKASQASQSETSLMLNDDQLSQINSANREEKFAKLAAQAQSLGRAYLQQSAACPDQTSKKARTYIQKFVDCSTDQLQTNLSAPEFQALVRAYNTSGANFSLAGTTPKPTGPWGIMSAGEDIDTVRQQYRNANEYSKQWDFAQQQAPAHIKEPTDFVANSYVNYLYDQQFLDKTRDDILAETKVWRDSAYSMLENKQGINPEEKAKAIAWLTENVGKKNEAISQRITKLAKLDLETVPREVNSYVLARMITSAKKDSKAHLYAFASRVSTLHDRFSRLIEVLAYDRDLKIALQNWAAESSMDKRTKMAEDFKRNMTKNIYDINAITSNEQIFFDMIAKYESFTKMEGETNMERIKDFVKDLPDRSADIERIHQVLNELPSWKVWQNKGFYVDVEVAGAEFDKFTKLEGQESLKKWPMLRGRGYVQNLGDLYKSSYYVSITNPTGKPLDVSIPPIETPKPRPLEVKVPEFEVRFAALAGENECETYLDRVMESMVILQSFAFSANIERNGYFIIP